MALLEQHKENAHCQWAVWKVDETIEQLLALLPHNDTYRQDMERFRASGRRLEWLAVRVLLHALLGEEKIIRYRADGKPYLSDRSYSLSISHTQGYAAVIVGQPGQEVGIDIERYGKRVHKIAPKFMRPDEYAETYQGTDTWGLLLHWSAKETMFKCLNTEEVDFREHLQVLPFQIEESGVFQALEHRTLERQRFLIHYRLFPDFVLTLIF